MENKLNPKLFKSVVPFYSEFKPSSVQGLKSIKIPLSVEVIKSPSNNLIKIIFSITRFNIYENKDEGVVFIMENQFVLNDNATLSKDEIYLMVSLTHDTLLKYKPKEASDNIGNLFPTYPCPSQDDTQDSIDFVFDSLR